VKPAPFTYHAPTDLDEAVELLSELGDDVKVLAGGQSLVPMLALRLTAFDHLVDVGRIDELRGIRADGDALWIGAMTTQASVERSSIAAGAVPLLSRATPLIGHFQIRNRGTVGGSVAHADPAAEYPAVAVTLDADLETISVRGRRTIPARDFFLGTWTTQLADDELLVGIRFPVWAGRTGFAVEEMAQRHGDFALAGATVAIALEGQTITRCSIGLFGLGSTPLRAPVDGLVGARPADVAGKEIGDAAVAALDGVPSDIHASGEYRTRVGAVMVARAWASAVEEAGRG
jgi:carbon-monoxide dehydrogenase medium subunit